MIEKIYYSFDLGVKIFECMIFLLFPTFLMERKVGKSFFSIMIIVAFIALFTVQSVYQYLDLTQNYIAILVIFIFSLISLEGTVSKKISISISTILLVIIVETPSIFITSLVFGLDTNILSENNTYYIFFVILSHFLLICVYVTISDFFKEAENLNNLQWIIISTIFLCADIADSFIINYTSDVSIPLINQYNFLGISICILFMVVFGFMTIANFSNANKIKIENEILRKERLLAEKNIETIRRSNSEIKEIKHDFKSYIFAINSFIKKGEYQKAICECNKVTGNLDMIETIIDCNNITINLVINEKIKECLEKSINLSCSVTEKIDIDEMSFVLVFNNLINNAIEYTQSQENPYREIKISIYQKMSFIVLKVENPIQNSILNSNPNLRTTKENQDEHGIGHKNIFKILNQIDGDIKYYEKDDFFIAEALFPLDMC